MDVSQQCGFDGRFDNLYGFSVCSVGVTAEASRALLLSSAAAHTLGIVRKTGLGYDVAWCFRGFMRVL